MSGRIVVGVGPHQPRMELVAWGAAEADGRGARLELVTAVPDQSSDAVAEDGLRWAATLATQRQPGLTVTTRLVPGSPEQVLRTEAAGADLLVIGADDISPFVEAITGSVAGALLTSAPCPMVVVPRAGDPAPREAPILVGVDTAETSRAAIEHGFAAASRSGRDMQVMLCWTAPRERADRQAERVEQHRALAVSLAGYAERYPDVTVTELLVDGDPTEELARRSRRAALLVLGSRGRGRLASLAFGSVSRTLVRRSRCPVAVIRPDLAAAAGVAS